MITATKQDQDYKMLTINTKSLIYHLINFNPTWFQHLMQILMVHKIL